MMRSVCRSLLGLAILTHCHPLPRKHEHRHNCHASLGLMSLPPFVVHLSSISFSRNTIHSTAIDSVPPKFPSPSLAFLVHALLVLYSLSHLGIYWYSFRSRSFGLILFSLHYIDHLSYLLYIYLHAFQWLLVTFWA
jgi:hypothetical protein